MRSSTSHPRLIKQLSLTCSALALAALATYATLQKPSQTVAHSHASSPDTPPSPAAAANAPATQQLAHAQPHHADSSHHSEQSRFILIQPNESIELAHSTTLHSHPTHRPDAQPNPRVTIVTSPRTASDHDHATNQNSNTPGRFRPLRTPGRPAQQIEPQHDNPQATPVTQTEPTSNPQSNATSNSQSLQPHAMAPAQINETQATHENLESITLPTQTNPNDTQQPDILGWLNIGYSSSNPDDRYIGQNLKHIGWARLLQREVRPQLDWGARRILVHNPFGIRHSHLAMPFDAYLEAQEDGLDWVTNGFVEAWQPVVQGAMTHGEPVEVIGYIGAISFDPEMEALRIAGDMQAWWTRAEASVAPLLDAGMSIAFDAAALLDEDHPGYAFMLELQSRGITVYSEAYPQKIRPHLFQFPVIMLKSYDRFINKFPERFPSRQQLAHRTTQLINNHEKEPNDPDWLIKKTLATLIDGDNVLVNINWLIEQGYTKPQLLEFANSRRMGNYD